MICFHFIISWLPWAANCPGIIQNRGSISPGNMEKAGDIKYKWHVPAGKEWMNKKLRDLLEVGR